LTILSYPSRPESLRHERQETGFHRIRVTINLSAKEAAMKTKLLFIPILSLGFLMLFSQCAKKTGDSGTMDMKGMDHSSMTMTMNEGNPMKQTATSMEAKVGDWVVCPVMGSKFQVKANSLFVDVDGKKIYICCPACADPLKKDPKKYLN
jgi:YHS domain-containing protein